MSNILRDAAPPPSQPSEGVLEGDEFAGSIKDLIFSSEVEDGSNHSTNNSNNGSSSSAGTRGHQFLSHAQADMIHGLNGKSVNLTFNSEEKLQREQILAALRKLDSGLISNSFLTILASRIYLN